jgi:hypothetical protein
MFVNRLIVATQRLHENITAAVNIRNIIIVEGPFSMRSVSYQRDNKYGNLALHVRGAYTLRQQNMDMSPTGLSPAETALAKPSCNYKLQTYPLVREGAPKLHNTQESKDNLQ